MYRIYGASKLWHWEKWLEWEHKFVHDVILISRWINVMRFHQTEDAVIKYTTREYAKKSWQMNIQDVSTADFLVVYSEDDVLRGALVEVGLALAYKTPIILVGNSPSFSEWTHLNDVYAHVEHLDDVLPALETSKKGW